jgi:predicted phage terminase large subunit-like protein
LSNFAGPALRELAMRRTLRMSLEAWCRFALADQGYAPAPHHVVIIQALEKLAAGQTQRLMLLLPPGSAKSTYASVLFPAWWMARFPRDQVIAASHTASLAEHFGRAVRSKLASHGARLDVFLRPDARAAGRFSTESGGEYFAIGVHGAVAGRRADLAIIDDPVASLEAAANAAGRDRVWNWFRSELVTRLKPGGRIALAMTRWHRDDLAGRLIEQGGWEVICLPALAELGDPMGRQIGDALWPDWESRAALLEKQESMGEASFAAIFQQSPLDEAGSIFDVAKIGFVDTATQGPSARGWDLASSIQVSRDPDWTVGVLLTREEGGSYVIDDVRRERVGPAGLDPLVLAVARQDGPRVTVGLPQDPGQAGAHQVLTLTRTLAGFRVHASTEKGPKWMRAQFVASQVARGNVKLRRAPWNRLFLEELAAFPHGRKDDQVDALARAFSLLATTGEPARFMTIPFFDR